MTANKKRTQEKPTGKRRRGSGFLTFPQVKGKTVQLIEVDPDAQAIVILFEDSTALSFDIDSCHVISPEFSMRKSGNWTPIKSWKTVKSGL